MSAAIVFASDCKQCPTGCGEPWCDKHGQHYADCGCVGPNQELLFSDLEGSDWRCEWQGMPEFIQERKREYAKLIIRFRNQEDLNDFARIVGQKLNRNSQCTWYPELQKGESGNSGKRYVNES